jgi:nucleoside-diphosphate-sugar epimerase
LTEKGRKEIVPYLKDVDTVIHLERIWGGEDLQNGLVKEINENLFGTVEFVKLAYQYSDEVIFTSSTDVYGGISKNPFTEEMPSNPTGIYSITKYSTEKYLQKIAENLSKKLIILRISTIYGPYEICNKAIPNFIKAFLKNESLEIRSSKDTFRDFIFIEDVCSAISLCLQYDIENIVTLNIGYGKTISLENLISVIHKIISNKETLTNLNEIKIKYGKILVDISKAKLLLGFYPKFNIYQGLHKEIEWLKEYLNIKS